MKPTSKTERNLIKAIDQQRQWEKLAARGENQLAAAASALRTARVVTRDLQDTFVYEKTAQKLLEAIADQRKCEQHVAAIENNLMRVQNRLNSADYALRAIQDRLLKKAAD